MKLKPTKIVQTKKYENLIECDGIFRIKERKVGWGRQYYISAITGEPSEEVYFLIFTEDWGNVNGADIAPYYITNGKNIWGCEEIHSDNKWHKDYECVIESQQHCRPVLKVQGGGYIPDELRNGILSVVRKYSKEHNGR